MYATEVLKTRLLISAISGSVIVVVVVVVVVVVGTVFVVFSVASVTVSFLAKQYC